MRHSTIALRFFTVLSLAAGLQVPSGTALDGFTSGLTSSAGTVLWSADMESCSNPGGDLSQWYAPGPFDSSTVVNCSAPGCPPGGIGTVTIGGGVFNSGIATTGLDFDFAHSGTYSAKLTISNTNTPESGARLFRWQEPQTHLELYYSAWYYFPRKYTPNGNPAWWNVFQWKSKSPILGDNPFFSVNVWNRPDGTMYFFLRDSHMATSYDQTVRDIPVRQWTRLEAFYSCAADTGRVVIWQDGLQLFDVLAPTRSADGDCQQIM